MSYNPSAPPPTYKDVYEKNAQNTDGPPIGFQASPSNTAQYNYSQVPLNSSVQQQQQQPPIIVTQPQPQVIVVQGGPMEFGPAATRLICPSCNKNIVTRVEYTNSMSTHAFAFVLCFMGCCCLSPIPYFIDSCKNSVHYCDECGSYLGTYTLSAANRRGYYR